MASKERAELVEEVKVLILDGNLYAWTLQETSERILATILAALQEPTSRMLMEAYIVQDDAALVNKASVPTFSDYWRAMLKTSPLGEQSE